MESVSNDEDDAANTSQTGFDFDVIHNTLTKSNSMKLQLHRTDRKSVTLFINVYNCYGGGKNIFASTEHEEFVYYKKFTTISTFESDLKEFLPILYKRINSAQECEYCDALFIEEKDEDRKLCENCLSWTCVTQRDTCIICSKSEYPTKFRCFTCIDSLVCLKCSANRLWKNKCPTCTKKQVKFGAKRVRYDDHEDSDDGEN
jgi:hypothetical protein